MPVVNMPEARAHLSRFVDAVESGVESEIIIARNGRPAARLVPLARPVDKPLRLGLAAGKYPHMSLEDLDASGDETARLFRGGEP
jgi:prevent-host-death family protein